MARETDASLYPPADLANNDNTAKDFEQVGAAKAMNIEGYEPSSDYAKIFRDDSTGMLADVTFRSWITDLGADLSIKDDLVPTLIKVIPSDDDSEIFWNPANDPADWQHVTTFTVGFGVAGNVSYPSGNWRYQATDIAPVATGNIKEGWYDAGVIAIGKGSETIRNDYDEEEILSYYFAERIPSKIKIDDTWHAGLNGRGGYLSAADPTGLAAAFAAGW